MKILFHNYSINQAHPLGIVCLRIKLTLERYMARMMAVDLDIFANEQILEESKTYTSAYMSYHNLMQLSRAVKNYGKEIKENKKITSSPKIVDIAELSVYFSCMFLDENSNDMADIKLATEIKHRKRYRFEELVLRHDPSLILDLYGDDQLSEIVPLGKRRKSVPIHMP
jgi:hypothetical protein